MSAEPKHSAIAPCPVCGIPKRQAEARRQTWRLAKRRQRKETK